MFVRDNNRNGLLFFLTVLLCLGQMLWLFDDAKESDMKNAVRQRVGIEFYRFVFLASTLISWVSSV